MAARRSFPALAVATALTVGGLVALVGPASPASAASKARVMKPVATSSSAAVRDLGPSGIKTHAAQERQLKALPSRLTRSSADPATQSAAAGPVVPAATLNVPGLGIDDSLFNLDAAPPDTNAAVGRRYLVQAVNEQFGVFDKSTGARVGRPFYESALFAGMRGTAGDGCATYDDGDPVVQYDKVRDRFILTQFAWEQYPAPMLECVAVSQSGDPTGAYDTYAFAYGPREFVDYPKLGIWPDGYYVTYNVFDIVTSEYLYGEMCAFDLNAATKKAKRAVTQQCFNTGPEGGGMLPADLDGALAPPADNADEYGVALLDNTHLGVWRQHTDWANASLSTNKLEESIAVDAFDLACGGGTCIPQKGTGQLLDSLSDRMMYRLAYRNLGSRQSLVGTHSVTGLAAKRTTGSGIRWYEFAPSGRSLSVRQQGTYTPDDTSRWMGSIATDKNGNIAVGYSASSTTEYPSIRWTAWQLGDPLGVLRAERVIQAGSGSQKNGGYKLSRWGDYSSMTVDPVDDCSFWFTTEYLIADGVFNWSTRIAKLKLPGCA